MNKSKLPSNEEEYFHQQNQRALERLRAKQQAASPSYPPHSLAAASGTSDRDVLERLAQAGISADELPAFELFPVIAMAWTDDDINVAEREAVRTIARERGIRPISRAATLVETWLRQSPPAELMDLWIAWLSSLDSDTGAMQIADLQRWLVPSMRRVAHAGRSLFGGWQFLSVRRRRLSTRVREALERNA